MIGEKGAARADERRKGAARADERRKGAARADRKERLDLDSTKLVRQKRFIIGSGSTQLRNTLEVSRVEGLGHGVAPHRPAVLWDSWVVLKKAFRY